MRFSRLGLLFLIISTVLFGANCSFYNRIFTRKDLVDGAKAYKDRKFADAEALFRKAVERDPQGQTVEGKTAQLFLARTLHSEYIGNRKEDAKAKDAIAQYQKVLAEDPNDQSSYRAIANLYENLGMDSEYQKWVNDRAANQQVKPEYRAEALTSLASKQNTCANDISDTDKTKKTVTKDGKQEYQFVKPENADDFTKLKQCVATGTDLISKALALEPDQVKNAKSYNIKSASDKELVESLDLFKKFESARSYNASLLVQGMRVAEMEGRTADRDSLKKQSDDARAKFTELSTVDKQLDDEIQARQAAKDDANANANKS